MVRLPYKKVMVRPKTFGSGEVNMDKNLGVSSKIAVFCLLETQLENVFMSW